MDQQPLQDPQHALQKMAELQKQVAAAAEQSTPSMPSPQSSQDNKEGKRQLRTNKQQAANTQSCSSAGPDSMCRTPKRKYHISFPGNITLTDQLLHFLRKAPDKGVRSIAKIAQRQIRRAANCARIMHAIFYDIFLLPAAHNYITPLLEQGKQHASSVALHKHSMGVSPKYAFGSLLLMGSSPNQGGSPPRLPGPISSSHNSIHKRLRQVASEYDLATRSIALNFNFGHSYHTLVPAIMAELKHIQAIPWPMVIDEPEGQTLLQCRFAHRRRHQQQHGA